MPVLLFQLWRFVTPGLKANEKRYALPFTAATVTLFALGAFVAYLTFPHALRFLINVSGPHVRQILSPNAYIQLILLLMLAFGVTFEFPVILVSLELAGVLTPAPPHQMAAVGDHRHGGLCGGGHSELGSVLDAGAGDPLARVLRGLDHHRQTAGQVTRRARRSA